MRQIILLTSWQCWFCSRLTNWLRRLSPLTLELVNFASCRCQKCLNQESWARSIRFHFEKDVELYGDFFWLLSLILSGALTDSWIVLAHCWLNIVARCFESHLRLCCPASAGVPALQLTRSTMYVDPSKRLWYTARVEGQVKVQAGVDYVIDKCIQTIKTRKSRPTKINYVTISWLLLSSRRPVWEALSTSSALVTSAPLSRSSTRISMCPSKHRDAWMREVLPAYLDCLLRTSTNCHCVGFAAQMLRVQCLYSIKVP